jgi:hypothetical protein
MYFIKKITGRTGGVAQVVECFSSMHKALGLMPNTAKINKK